MKTTNDKRSRFLAMLLLAAMLISMVPASAFADVTFTVSVTDDKGSAVNGAQVKIGIGEDVLAQSSTNAAGKAEFTADLTGADLLTVTAEGYLPYSAAVDVSALSVDVSLQPVPTATVTGTVKDGSGTAVSGATVKLTDTVNTYSTSSNADGSFSISGVVIGEGYTVSASKAGYKPASKAAELENANELVIIKKNSGDLTFTQESITVDFDAEGTDALVNAVTNANGRTVAYSSGNESVAAVSDTGALTIKSAGTAVITAKCEENDDYAESTGSYTLTVNKATQTLKFENASVEVKFKDVRTNQAYGGNVATASKEGSKITYSVVEGSSIITGFDSAAGTFTLTETGTVKIKATAKLDNYNDATAEYTLTVKEPFEAKGSYEATGTSVNSDWFTGNVTIEGRKGCKLLYKDAALNAALGYAGWQDSLLLTNLVAMGGLQEDEAPYTPDGIFEDMEIYIESGEYVIETTLEKISKDSKKPTATLTIEEKSDWDSRFLYIISRLTHISTDPAEMTVTAEDEHSNIGKVFYYFNKGTDVLTFDDLDALDESKWTEWTDYKTTPVQTDTNAFFSAYVKVCDQAGNYIYVNSSGVILDTTAPNASVTDTDGNTLKSIYTDDVSLLITAEDGKEDSGIKQVKYWIETPTDKTNESDAVILFTATDTTIEGKTGVTKDDLVHEWKATEDKAIKFVAADYNCAVTLHIKVTDRADNSTVTDVALDFDLTKPTVSVDYGPAAVYTKGEKDYFDGSKAITVTVTERGDHFDGKNVTYLFKNDKGEKVKDGYTVSEWTVTPKEEGKVSDEDTSTAKITFTKDGFYSFEGVTVKDTAGNESEGFTVTGENENNAFFIDTKVDLAEISCSNTTWSEIVAVFTFGIIRNSQMDIEGKFKDNLSGIKSFEYYVHKGRNPATEEELEKASWESVDISTETAGSNFYITTISPNATVIVYAKATDNVGNVRIVGTDGMVLDNTKSGLTVTLPGDKNSQDGAYIYKSDVKVKVEANDEIGETNEGAGIKSIDYWIKAQDTAFTAVELQVENLTDEDVLDKDKTNIYTHDGKNVKISWSKDEAITVSAENYNRMFVRLIVRVTDLADNVATDIKTFRICKDQPKISITFDNNDAENTSYFKKGRIATIKITDWDNTFDADAVKITATATASNPDAQTAVQTALDTAVEGLSFVGKNDIYTGTLVFNEAAEYSLSVSYNNLADYNAEVSFGESAGAVTTNESGEFVCSFTVDLSDPTGTVKINDGSFWDKLLASIFPSKFSSEYTVKGTFNDANPIASFEYLKDENTSAPKTAEDLDEVTSWTKADITGKKNGDEIELFTSQDESKNFVVYAKITDYSGRYKYISTTNMISDNSAPKISVAPSAVDAKNVFYNDDIDFSVEVTEPDNGAGIKSIEYWVECDDAETQRETLFEETDKPVTDGTSGSNGNLSRKETVSFTVTAEDNNSDNVTVFIKAVDNLDNEDTQEIHVSINCTAPVLAVEYDDVSTGNTVYNDKFYQNARTATLTITDRDSTFDADKVVITCTAKDAAGNKVDDAYSASAWTKKSSGVYTATVTFSGQANYDFKVSYTNKAKLSVEEYKTEFTVDKTTPVGSITVKDAVNENVWDKIISALTFGLYRKETQDVWVKMGDVTSPIKEAAYYIDYGTELLSSAQIDALGDAGWKSLTAQQISAGVTGENGVRVRSEAANKRFTAYVRITDSANNVTYVCTDGYIVDNSAPVITKISQTEPNENSLYKDNVSFGFEIEDPIVNEVSSGVKASGGKTWWSVWKDISGVEHPGEGSKLKPNEFSGDVNELELDKTKNNSNDVVLYVRAEDNAGNENITPYSLSIDATAPKISFKCSTGDILGDFTGTITVEERNFNAEKVSVIGTLNGTQALNINPAWTVVTDKCDRSGNGDDTVNIGTFSFSGDGVYSITSIICTDDAGNETVYNVEPGSGTCTVDKTKPVITITYDNNDVANDIYYKNERTATIKVTEKNFKDGTAEIKVSNAGKDVAVPQLSAWTHTGDTHTATVKFSDDAEYTMKVTASDKAGNVTVSEEQKFVVDKTKPAVTITGVKDKSANNDSGKIGFTLTATDTNFDVFVPRLVAVVDKDGKITKIAYGEGVTEKIGNGYKYTVDDLKSDGIYKLTCTVVDKAGNAYNTVVTVDDAGNKTTVAKTAQDQLLVFSVNRNGSTFDLDENTLNVLDRYYVQNVLSDVVITEVNPDKLVEQTVTLNGKELVKNVDYTTKRDGNEDSWNTYTYTISKSLFADEKEYSIVISSKDAAKNTAFSDIKDAAVVFVVDRTAPVVSVSGIADGGRYRTDAQTVTVIPTDDGGALNALVISTVDDEGNVLKELVNLSGKELEEALEKNGGKISFELEEGLFQNVKIVCTDCATDENGNVNTYENTVKDISVSSSGFMIFWANRPLRYGVIGGIGVVGIALLWFLLAKKKSSEEEESKAS